MKGSWNVLWTCADGRRIRVGKMTTSHIERAIAVFEERSKQADAEFACAINPFQGEMAALDFDNAQDAFWEKGCHTDPEQRFPHIRTLKQELKRRQKRRMHVCRL